MIPEKYDFLLFLFGVFWIVNLATWVILRVWKK